MRAVSAFTAPFGALPGALSVATLVASSVAWLGACAATAPLETPAPAPAPGPSSVETVAADRVEPASPDVVRCGVDDAPVPIGRGRDPRRPDARLALLGQPLAFAVEADVTPVRAMLPGIALTPRAEGVAATPQMLRDVFEPCADRAEAADGQEIRAEVIFGSNGYPRTSRPTTVAGEARPVSPFARCIAERACQLPITPSLAGKATTAIVGLAIVPPVFHGTVTAIAVPVVDERHRRAPTPAMEAKAEAIGKLVRAAGQRCAERLPPADDVFLDTVVAFAGRKPRAITFRASLGHGEILRACVEGELRGPVSQVDHFGTVHIALQIVGPASSNVPSPFQDR